MAQYFSFYCSFIMLNLLLIGSSFNTNISMTTVDRLNCSQVQISDCYRQGNKTVRPHYHIMPNKESNLEEKTEMMISSVVRVILLIWL